MDSSILAFCLRRGRLCGYRQIHRLDSGLLFHNKYRQFDYSSTGPTSLSWAVRGIRLFRSQIHDHSIERRLSESISTPSKSVRVLRRIARVVHSATLFVAGRLLRVSGNQYSMPTPKHLLLGNRSDRVANHDSSSHDLRNSSLSGYCPTMGKGSEAVGKVVKQSVAVPFPSNGIQTNQHSSRHIDSGCTRRHYGISTIQRGN